MADWKDRAADSSSLTERAVPCTTAESAAARSASATAARTLASTAEARLVADGLRVCVHDGGGERGEVVWKERAVGGAALAVAGGVAAGA